MKSMKSILNIIKMKKLTNIIKKLNLLTTMKKKKITIRNSIISIILSIKPFLKRERKKSIPKSDVNIKDRVGFFSQKKKEEEPIARRSTHQPKTKTSTEIHSHENVDHQQAHEE